MYYELEGEKKSIVDFNAIIYNAGIVVFNLQKKAEGKIKVLKMKTDTEWKFQ